MAPRLLRFDVAYASLRRAYNDIEITLRNGSPQKIIWLELIIAPQKEE